MNETGGSEHAPVPGRSRAPTSPIESRPSSAGDHRRESVPDDVARDAVTLDAVTLDDVTLDDVTLDDVVLDDARLVAECLGGRDPEAACRALVTRYWKAVVSSIRFRVRSLRDAEEIAQDTFTRAFRSLRSLQSPSSFASWIFRIASNQATDFLRGRPATVSLDELAESGRLAALDAEEQDDLEVDELIGRVLEAVGQLPERYRLVVTLRYVVGLSAKEIARELDEPEGTIRNRVFRAVAKLKKMFKVER